MASTKNPDAKKIKKFVELNKKHKSALEPDKLFAQIRKGDKSALSQAITLTESSKEKDQDAARQLIQKCLPYSGKSIRI
ncbi:MAG: methylmalonyl Co-A mutase-associated GTPase MeaB, partial [Crocinitomicaceae bacterium]|nr:methylmalonyl Co-A mutase-associated GTPase MeaB [Crocinitomicaceae bacterium]